MATSCARKSAFFVVSYANVHFNETGHQFFAKKKQRLSPGSAFKKSHLFFFGMTLLGRSKRIAWQSVIFWDHAIKANRFQPVDVCVFIKLYELNVSTAMARSYNISVQ